MKKFTLAVALGASLLGFGYTFLRGDSLIKQEQVLDESVPLQYSPRFKEIRYNNKLHQKKSNLPKLPQPQPLERKVGDKLAQDSAFLQRATHILEDKNHDEDVYALTALKLLEYCQNIEDKSYFKDTPLKTQFTEMFLGLNHSLNMVSSDAYFPGREAFRCDDERSFEEGSIENNLEENCNNLNLADTVKIVCADIIQQYFDCNNPEEAEAWIYAQALLARPTEDDAYAENAFATTLSECQDQEVILDSITTLIDRFTETLSISQEMWVKLDAYRKKLEKKEETEIEVTSIQEIKPPYIFYPATQ